MMMMFTVRMTRLSLHNGGASACIRTRKVCALHNTLPCSTSYFTQRNNDSEGNKSTFTTQTNALFQNCNSQYHAAQISNKQSFEETNNKQNVCTLHTLIIPGGANMKIQNIRYFTSYSRPQKVTVAP